MKSTKQCYPPRAIAVAQRPVSDATDFYDTEFEMSDSEDEDEDESPRMSMDSVWSIPFSTRLRSFTDENSLVIIATRLFLR